MTKKIRTKKNRKYRKKNKSFKFGGADISSDVSSNVSPYVSPDVSPGINNNSVDELTQKIQAQHSLGNFLPNFNLGDSKVLKKVVELSEVLMMKTIDNTAQYFNIDLNDSEQFKRRLEELKIILNDPKNKELMKETIANFAQVGVVALEAAEPFMDKLVSDIFDKLTIMGNEFGEAGVKIGLNTLEEIPGYGIIIGTIRSASNAAEAVIASTNTASEIVTITADTTNASLQNFDKLLKEKGDLLARTTESINKFSENMKSMPNNISTPSAGGSRRHKMGHNKTKKVRFNF
jgi:hypothetical protein